MGRVPKIEALRLEALTFPHAYSPDATVPKREGCLDIVNHYDGFSAIG